MSQNNSEPVAKNPFIKVPISELDLEYFNDLIYNDVEFDWIFPDSTGKMINIRFIQDNGEEDE